MFPSIVPTIKIRIPEEFCKKSFERGSGKTCSQRFSPKLNPFSQNRKWGWKGDFEQPIFIPLTVGVFLLYNFSLPAKEKLAKESRSSPAEVPTCREPTECRWFKRVFLNFTEEFRRGFGGNLFSKVPPETEPHHAKPKTGVRRGNSNSPFPSP